MTYRRVKSRYSSNKQRRVWVVTVADVSGEHWLSAPDHPLRRFTDPDRALAYAFALEQQRPRFSYGVRALRG